jgi:Fur family transcriptional regulator, stress-responsive regulator
MAVSEELVNLLRRHRLRVTPQRRAILEAFRGAPEEHLSAEEVLSRASLAVPEIGRGTVYATLVELADLRVLAAVGNADSIRYETNVARHDHFRCRVCGRTFDVDLGGARLPAPSPEGYCVETVVVSADGVCPECAAAADNGVGQIASRSAHPSRPVSVHLRR